MGPVLWKFGGTEQCSPPSLWGPNGRPASDGAGFRGESIRTPLQAVVTLELPFQDPVNHIWLYSIRIILQFIQITFSYNSKFYQNFIFISQMCLFRLKLGLLNACTCAYILYIYRHKFSIMSLKINLTSKCWNKSPKLFVLRQLCLAKN